MSKSPPLARRCVSRGADSSSARRLQEGAHTQHRQPSSVRREHVHREAPPVGHHQCQRCSTCTRGSGTGAILHDPVDCIPTIINPTGDAGLWIHSPSASDREWCLRFSTRTLQGGCWWPTTGSSLSAFCFYFILLLFYLWMSVIWAFSLFHCFVVFSFPQIKVLRNIDRPPLYVRFLFLLHMC